MMYVQIAAITNQTAFTVSPRANAMIAQAMAPAIAITAKTALCRPVMGERSMIAMGGRSWSVRIKLTSLSFSLIATAKNPTRAAPTAPAKETAPMVTTKRGDYRDLMPLWRLRDYDDDDLDQAIQIWDQSRNPGSAEPVFSVAEVMAAARSGQPAVVADIGEEVVGMAVARTDGERAWVLLVALASRWRHRGIGSALLADLERRLRSLGLRKICTIVPEGATGSAALENSGYTRRDGLLYYEMIEHLRPDQANILAALGGRMLSPGLWHELAGMEQEKQIIEQRIIAPLAHPDIADRYGVRPPKAVILFGPPGTGKTSFAKGISSRLGWPFVELFPSRLAAAAEGEIGRA